MLLGALFGGLAGSLATRKPTGEAIAVGATAGALLGGVAASSGVIAVPLDLAQQHAATLGLRYISATRMGPRALELTLLHGGAYYAFKAAAPATLATQDEIDDALYDTLVHAVKIFHEQRQRA
jgi:hypothetical protein